MANNETRKGLKSRAKKPLPFRGGVGVGESVSDLADDRQNPNGLAHPLTPSLAREGEPERTCVLTREHGTRAGLIRLALGPDGIVMPDLRAKAGGRGAWIGVDRPALETAIAKGKLKGALARAFKTSDFTIPADLPQRIADGLQQAALDRLGLETRAGALLTGSEKIADAARRGQIHLLIHASDASEDGNRKLDQALRMGLDEEGSGRQGMVIPADRHILSMALGRENVVHIALTAPASAARVSDALGRWCGFIGRLDGVEPCEPVSQGPSALSSEVKGSVTR
jgi:predicted RNA-binding protein YlxR (DUF448 family)